MHEQVMKSFRQGRENLERFLSDDGMPDRVMQAADIIARAFSKGGKVISCGNGGSMCDAMHFAEEFSGRYRRDRPPLPAIAISDPSHLSCVGNDYGFEHVFSRQVEALGREGDVLLAISTSGNSPNVLRAARSARERDMSVIGLLGRDGGELKPLCDVPIIVPGETTDRMQELHILIIHIIIECVERKLFPELYEAG